MKKIILNLVICCLSMVAFSAVQPMISYQGKLTNAAGVGVDGTRNMVFRIYNTETGGTPLWGELHTNVSVEHGLFDVILGSVIDLDLDFSDQYWLEVEIDGSVLIPRVRLTPSPYALRAAVADSLAGFSGIADNDWEIDGDIVYTLPIKDVGIGTATPGAKLHVVGNALIDGNLSISSGIFDGAGYGTADQVLMSDGLGDIFWGDAETATSHWSSLGGDIYRETGNVGIGTNAPSRKLHLVGDQQIQGDLYISGGIHDGGSLGSAGQVLTSDGAGNVLWAEAPTGLWSSSAGGDTVFLLGSSVGVGTNSPLGTMHVVGDIYSDGRIISQDTILGSSIIIDGTTTPGTITEAHGKLSLTNDTLVTMGRVGIGTITPNEKLEVIGNAKTNEVHLASGGTTGWENQIAWFASDRSTINHVLYMDADDGDKLKLNMGYGGSPAEKVFSFSNAHVGLGTASPTEQLHLTHNIRVEGSFHDGTGTGDAGQVVTSNGAGGWSWQDGGSSTVEILDDLLDVDTAGVVDGQVLKWIAVANQWRPSNDVGGPAGADNWGTQVVMSDSSLLGDGTAGDRLGVDWDTLDAHINRYVVLNDLHNVNDVGVTDGELLTWVASANEWRPVALDSGGLGDNWGTQIVETDASINGDGTAGDLLSVNWDTLKAYSDTLTVLNDLADVDTDSLGEFFILGWDHEDSLWKAHYDDDGDMNNELIDSIIWEPVDSGPDTNYSILRVIERSVERDIFIPVNRDSLQDNAIDELMDVDVSGVAAGDLMQWNGTDWVPVTTQSVIEAHSIADLGDVDDSLLAVGDVLQWNGTHWAPGIDPEDFINVWEDFHCYIAPLTDNTSDFRIFDRDSSLAVSLIETTGVATATWYGVYVDRRGVADSDGYGIYAHGGTDGGVSAGSEFYGVKGKASGGNRVYGLYGDGDAPGVGGTGYGVYGRGKDYGVYGYSENGMAGYFSDYVGVNTNHKNAKFEVYTDQDGNSVPSGIFRMHDSGFDDTLYFHQKWGGGGANNRALIHAKHNGETKFMARTDGNAYVAGELYVGSEKSAAQLQVTAKGSYSVSEDATHPFEIWDGNHTLYMGADSTSDLSYIQSVGVGAFRDLTLNARGGGVVVGGFAAEGNNFRVFGRDNDGTHAAVKINDPTNHMLIDGNEIDSDGRLSIQTNTNHDIEFGGGAIFINDGVSTNSPIHIKRYSFTCGGCFVTCTGYSVSDWTAVIAGVDIHGDINETERHTPLLKWLMNDDETDWRIEVDMAHDHSDSDWIIDVMFIRKEIAYDGR